MNATITFSGEPASMPGATGWFDFDPMEKFAWSLEETVARINGLTTEDLFGGDKEKSVFDATGLIDYGDGFSTPFLLCDWREDGRVHVMFPTNVTPRASKAQFTIALHVALSKSILKGFSTNYPYSGDVFSWPPTPSKEDAVAMAVDALNDVLAIPKREVALSPSLRLVAQRCKEARKALLEAF